MKSLSGHIAYARSQPHHVQRKIVTAVSGALTALIAVVWFTVAASSGEFAIQQPVFAGAIATSTDSIAGSDSQGGNTPVGLAGAASALTPAADHTAAHIEIVDVPSSTSTAASSSATVIPF
jgi:hypothetical protein